MRRTLEERNVRKILKRGASYSITLPIELVRKLKWRNGQKVIVTEERGKLIVKDWK
ncbi:AbrB/MazE/SpoVT family DNA-binding domain-containing protein [Patescibacteria group bacterium]